MAELLEHIAEVVETTRSIVEIIPETAAADPFMMGMPRTTTFSDAPPLVYAESLNSGQLIDYPALVKRCRRSYDLLRAVALLPETTDRGRG
ncbi:Scr1 family TA system antitoxin-like transcriptional regulator [Streptomyces sp. NPDC059900]|uniref:Scr1 family TA system antitoxin-like transcriptional regulator n=1 Tax=Streptomyces sp. NPDC059900 TaxID=3155816 RepID=UPI0034370809